MREKDALKKVAFIEKNWDSLNKNKNKLKEGEIN